MWVLKRRKIKTLAHRMMVYKKKGSILHGFLTWKKGFPLVVDSIKSLNRVQLHQLVARMDRDIKTL